MWAVVVIPLEKRVEPTLLLQEIGGRGLGRFAFERQVHTLVAAVLFRMAGLDTFDQNAQTEPPDREATQPIQRIR